MPDPRAPGQTIPCEQLHGIFLPAVWDSQIEECLIHDTLGDAVYVHQGTLSAGSQRVRVAHNEMHSLSRVGVNLAGAGHSIAEANFIHDSDNNALKMEQDGDDPLQVAGNRFVSNIVYRAGGLSLSSPGNRANITDILIRGNTFNLTTTPAINLGEVSKINVVGNKIWRSTSQGITIRSSQEITIKENSIREVVLTQRFDAAVLTESPAPFPPSAGIIIESNEISHNPMPACKLRQSVGAKIQYNLLLDNIGQGSLAGQATGVELAGSSQDTLVRGNIIKGNNLGVLVAEDARHNRFRENKILTNLSGGIWALSDAGPGNDFGGLGGPGFNCIQGNTAFGLRNDKAVEVDARGNFWGCAAGPGNAGCDAVVGPVSVTPVLRSCPR